MLVVTSITTYFHITSILVAASWLAAFVFIGLLYERWWRKVSAGFGSLSDAEALRRQSQMIFFCFLVTATSVAPFLFNPDPGQASAVASVVFCAAMLMAVAAQHSMANRMFLWTAPVPALALTVNMVHLVHGLDIWVMAVLAVCFVGSARNLQKANTAAEAEIVMARVEADRANKAKSIFLATISHEIRTPLNGVLGMAQAMRYDALNPAQRQRLDVIQRSGEALLALLNDVLDMSKIEAGKVDLELIDFDLGATMKAAYDAFLAITAENGVTMALDVEACSGVFHGDPTRVRQILYNLLSNAVKFTERGRIDVRARRTEGGVRISVQDTGIGMQAETAQRMFEKFSQADASVTRRFGGTGLGLSICRELAELMGGSIGVDSALGQGSTFTVDLPLKFVGPAEPAPAAPTNSLPPGLIGRAEKLRILVAEDHEINRFVLRNLLDVIGNLDLEMVANGALAIAAWEAREWDLILMDVNMPDMDGVTATRSIRSMERQTQRRRTPIIALTANAMSHQVDEYLQAGMDGHLAKPIEAASLFAAIAQAVAASPQTAVEAPTAA
jgi:signal transduction histidine kinase/CheY-like chemotaxis protein